MEQLTKNQAVATSQEAVQNQNEPQLRDENAHNDKSVHGVLNPTYQAGLRRDAVQPDIEAERKKRDEIEAGKSYCSRRFGGATDRKSGSAGMPRPISYAVFCLKKKNARATRSRPSTSCATACSSRRTNASTWRDDAMPSRAELGIAGEESHERVREVRLQHPDLFLRVPLADRDALSFERLVIHRHRERSADFVHAGVPSADRSRLIVEHREALPQVGVNRSGSFGEPFLVHEREDAGAHGRQTWREPQDNPLRLAE